MTASKDATARFSAERPIGSDLERVDAHRIGPDEYEDIPELTDEMIARALSGDGGQLVRRGRPRKPGVKEAISIRLSPAVLAHFRAQGPGWQTRIDEILLRVVESEKG